MIVNNTQDLNLLAKAKGTFVEHLRSEKRSISTILAYGKDIDQLVDFLNKKGITQASTVKSADLEEFKEDLAQKKYTPKSISRKLNSIKTFFKLLKAEEVIQTDPATTISHPKYQIAPPRILTKMEYRALRDTCRQDIRIAAIVELMLQTGIRIGEVSRLEMENIQDNDLDIKAYESQPARTIPLNKTAKQALDKYLAERAQTKTQIVFVTKTGRSFLARNIRAAIDRCFRLAGIENARVNDLRNTWLAHHLAAGTSPVFLAKMAGHRRLTTTERYLEFIKEGTEKRGKEKLEEL